MIPLMICPGAAQFGCIPEDCIHAANHKELPSCTTGCKYKGGDLHGCVPSAQVRYSKLDMPQVRGMRAQNFERLNKGFLGTLSRHGKTLVIVLEMPTEKVAENAEEFICGEL